MISYRCVRSSLWIFAVGQVLAAAAAVCGEASSGAVVVKQVAAPDRSGRNLLDAERWRPYEKGFDRSGAEFVCDNGNDASARRGLSQTVELNQSSPAPILATARSKAEGVSGAAGPDYALYLDLILADGTPLWGQTASFAAGTHDWQRRQVLVVPEKPIRSVTVHLLLRERSGKAWFCDPDLRVVDAAEGMCLFDGLPVRVVSAASEGFQIRDVAVGSDFQRITKEAMGLHLDVSRSSRSEADFFDLTLQNTTGRDRAVTLVYSVPVESLGLQWLHDPRQTTAVQSRSEYMNASRFAAGANGRLSRYPFAAVANGERGWGLGIDPAWPAFFRVGYNAGSNELYLAFDVGLAAEQPTARLRLCRFSFDPRGAFRSALARYYEIFPDAFRCRTPQQGLWMPFAKISEVRGWEDFGFRFKEGNNETQWDDQHDIVTFRYTEPMTWWMTMGKELPRTMEAAIAEAQRLAAAGRRQARALLSSGYHDESGQFSARILDTPWCNGAVWSMNSIPGIRGDVTDFQVKWNEALREELYGTGAKGNLDGEYVDSSEGYVTDQLNFRRDHFASAQTPLCFSSDSHRVAVFRGLIAFEYVRGLERDVHGLGKLMMANSTPIQLFWLAPLLDVMGTETDWNPQGRWRPMSDAELLYRRAMCRGKPYCFLMNTRFEDFSKELVEKYMQRSLAYGMFPGFFSHNASQGHYFTRPELYERDRPLFKKYVPLCKLVAEAGWQPLTGARSSDPRVYLERFGNRYLTVFNDSGESRTATITLDRPMTQSSRELVQGLSVEWSQGKASVTLEAEHVALLELP